MSISVSLNFRWEPGGVKDWRTSTQRDRCLLSSDVQGRSPRRQSLSSLVASLKLAHGGRLT